MTNTEAIRTIREALEEVSAFLLSDYGLDGSAADYYGTAISERAAPVFDKTVNAITALDSLAVEPSASFDQDREDFIKSCYEDAVEPSEDAPDFDHYWQIILSWSQDMGTIKKLSIHEMRMLSERLQSITAHAITARDERIRRECAERAKQWYYNTIASAELIELEPYLADLRMRQITTLESAIMGKEAGK
jgi:hypothetical protein